MGLLNKLWQQWHHTQNEAHAVPVMADEDFHYAPHFIAGERLIVESNQVLEVINPCNSRAECRLHVASGHHTKSGANCQRKPTCVGGVLICNACTSLKNSKTALPYSNTSSQRCCVGKAA